MNSSKLAFVIEDDFDGSMVFAKALEANGLAPEQIMTGNLALEKLSKEVPVLVVLDLHLPNVPGPEILKTIRADGRLAETLVVVVSADARMTDVVREEADLVIQKPTTFSQVRDLVGRLIAVRERNAKAAEEAHAETPTPAAPAETPEKPAAPAVEASAPAPAAAEPSAEKPKEAAEEKPAEKAVEKPAAEKPVEAAPVVDAAPVTPEPSKDGAKPAAGASPASKPV